jgi:hypothetical protein
LLRERDTVDLLAEFCLSKKPVIASGWSGQVDFLDGEFAVLLSGQLTPTHPSAQSQGLILPGALWFTVDHNLAAKAIRRCIMRTIRSTKREVSVKDIKLKLNLVSITWYCS